MLPNVGCACRTVYILLKSINALLQFPIGDKHALYGNQRLWGAIGWGIFSLLAGLLVDEMSRGMGGYKDYSGVFYLMIALIGIDLLVSFPIEVILI